MNENKKSKQLSDIYRNLSNGDGVTIACKRAGVPYRTFARWAANDPEILKEVTARVVKRKDKARIKRLEEIAKGKNPTAALNAIKLLQDMEQTKKQEVNALEESTEGEITEAAQMLIQELAWRRTHVPLPSKNSDGSSSIADSSSETTST